MKNTIEFVMWLAQNDPDCLSRHQSDEDWGKKEFENLYQRFVEWSGNSRDHDEEVLKIMQNFDDTLDETDYNVGFLNGMETIFAVYQDRNPSHISLDRVKLRSEALRFKAKV